MRCNGRGRSKSYTSAVAKLIQDDKKEINITRTVMVFLQVLKNWFVLWRKWMRDDSVLKIFKTGC